MTGGGQYLGRPNVERSIFQNFEISNINIMKDFFQFFHFRIDFFICVNYSNTQNIQFTKLEFFRNFHSFLNCQISKDF